VIAEVVQNANVLGPSPAKDLRTGSTQRRVEERLAAWSECPAVRAREAALGGNGGSLFDARSAVDAGF
jgi:hypothetical protein